MTDDVMYDAYNELIEELLGDTLDASVTLLRILSEFKHQGRIEHGIPVPEGVDISSLFRSNN